MNAAPECRRPDQDTASAEGGLCAVPWGVFAREGWAPDSRGTGVEGSAFVPETTMPPAIELGGTVDVSAAQTLEPLLTSGAGGVLRGGSATACSPRAMASKTSRRCTGTSLGASTPRRTLSPRISTTTIVMSLLMTMHSSFFRDKTSIDRSLALRKSHLSDRAKAARYGRMGWGSFAGDLTIVFKPMKYKGFCSIVNKFASLVLQDSLGRGGVALKTAGRGCGVHGHFAALLVGRAQPPILCCQRI